MFICLFKQKNIASSQATNEDRSAQKSHRYQERYTDKKEKNFLVYKEIHKGLGAKSYMTNGLLIYG
jgi:hypothetical protein